MNVFQYYFANESLPFDLPKHFIHIKTGHGEWSDRLRIALSNIPEKCVIYLQEDFLIQYVDSLQLINAINYHLENCNIITKLGTNDFFDTIKTTTYHCNFEIIEHVPGSIFVMSHQPIAIFDNEFMRCTCPYPPVSARTHEYIATDALNNMREIFHNVKILSNNHIIEYIHCIADGELIVNLEEICP